MNPFNVIAKPVRLTDQIARVLAERILQGALLPESRLPAEKELAESFGVSRSVIREAVSMLKYDGLVETRQGSGVYVSATPTARSFRLDRPEAGSAADLAAIFELRIVVEAAAAGLAAERRGKAQLDAMAAYLEVMAADVSGGRAGIEADADFHTAIAAASGNAYVERFIEFLGGALREAIRTARSNSAQYPGFPDVVQAEHRRVFEAIAAGDPAAAEDAMRQHVLAAMTRLGLKTKKTKPEEENDCPPRRSAGDSRPGPVATAPRPGPAAA